MCHELKPHVKLWLLLIYPSMWKSMNAFDTTQHDIDDADASVAAAKSKTIIQEPSSLPLTGSIIHFGGGGGEPSTSSAAAASSFTVSLLREMNNTRAARDVPLILRDPVAILLIIISNLPVDIEKSWKLFPLYSYSSLLLLILIFFFVPFPSLF